MAARRAALSGLGLVLANLSTAQNTTPLAVLKQAFGLSEHTIGRRVEPVDRLAARAELAAARHPSSASRGAVGATVPCTPFERVPHNYMLEHESFLPPRSAGVSSGVPSACPPDAAAAELRAHLLALGHPRRCAAAAQVTADNVGYGIGSVINAWVKPYQYAIAHNLTFWSPPLGSYRHKPEGASSRSKRRHGGDVGGGGGKVNDAGLPSKGAARCAMDSMACFTLPLSSCEEVAQLDGEAAGCRSGRPSPSGRDRCIPRMIGENRSLRVFSLMHTNRKDPTGPAPPRNLPLRYRSNGHFWFVSQLLSHILRPNEAMQATLREAKRSMRWEERLVPPMLSLHVRRGDACNAEQIASKARRCDTLATYMDSVTGLAANFSYRTIFLATDDESVVADTAKYPEFVWLYLPPTTLDRGESKKHKWEANLRSGAMDNYGEAEAALVDLLLMSEGTGFVGKFTSNLDRIAYALMAAKGGGYYPSVSLDSKWCADWGAKAGHGRYGDFYC